MQGNNPYWNNFDLNAMGYFTEMYTRNNSSNGSGTENDNSSNNCNCNNEEHINEILSRIKPLIFESVNDAESQLNTGIITNIYYGQTVIVKNNGKYLSYTVQKGINGYIVEPVGAVATGTIEGLFWQENE